MLKDKLKMARQRLVERQNQNEPEVISIDGTRPLTMSSNQRRLWFLDQYDSNHQTYLVPLCFHIQGDIDLASMEASLKVLAQRHTILRTRFEPDEKDAQQVIVPDGQIPLIYRDFRSNDSAEALKFVEDFCIRDFDLTKAPLVRACVVSFNNDEAYLGFCFHHIICDAWSLDLFFADFSKLYSQHLQGETIISTPVTRQYYEFSEWERNRSARNQFQKSCDFWRDKLKGDLPILDFGRHRDPTQSYRGKECIFSFENSLRDGIITFAERQGVTPSVVLLTAYTALISRYSRQEEVVIGIPVANRIQSSFEKTLGFFTNTIPLRQAIESQDTFLSLLKRTQKELLESLEHQDYPFDHIVRDLKIGRNKSHSPLFQTLFAMQNSPVENEFVLHGVEVKTIALHSKTSKVDLTLSATISKASINLSLEYATDLFDTNFIESLVEAFKTLIVDAIDYSHKPVLGLSLLPDYKANRLLDETLQKVVTYDQGIFIHKLIEDRVVEGPERIAAYFEGQSFTYERLNKDANRFARHLFSQGMGQGSRVGLLLDRSYELIVAMLGVLKAGAAWIPLSTENPRERIDFILEDSQAAILVAQYHHAEILKDLSIKVLLLDHNLSSLGEYSNTNLDLILNPQDTAYIYYTSGTTGNPKGVLIDHLCAQTRLDWLRSAYPLTPVDRVLAKTPLIFDVIVWEIYLPLFFGASIVIAPPRAHSDPEAIAELLRKFKITLAHFVPSMLQAFLDSEMSFEFPDLKWVAISGEGCSLATRDLFHQKMRAELHNQYGQTETAEIGFWNCSQGIQPHYVPIGYQVGAYALFILDDYLNPVPSGVTGELYVASEGGLAQGYLGRPGLTAEKFLPNPFEAKGSRIYKTGDLVKRSDDGTIKYIGRADNQLKVRGCRVELGEIESQILNHKGIKTCVVLPKKSDYGTTLVAYVIPKAGEETPSDLQNFLKTRLATYMLPSFIVSLNHFPLTPSGKIAFNELPSPTENSAPSRTDTIPQDFSQLESQLHRIWCQILGVKGMPITANFFDVGGDSLSTIRVINTINSHLGVKLRISDIFDNPTIAQLAKIIAPLKPHSPRLSEFSVGSSIALNSSLSSAQRRIWFAIKTNPQSALYNIGRVFRLSKSVESTKIQSALRVLVSRHESLRTMFHEEQGEPRQVVLPSVSIPYTKLTYKSPPELKDMLVKEATQTIDLESGALFRLTHFQNGDETHISFVIHHIIADGWSLSILFNDLSRILSEIEENLSHPSKLSHITYSHYIDWQSSQEQVDLSTSQLKYWREKLQGYLPFLDLPTQKVRSSIPTFAGELLRFQIDAKLTEKLRKIGREHNTTLFMTLLTIYKVVLARLTGQSDIIVGTPVAGRDRAEFEETVGFFVNTLAIRDQVDTKDNFSNLLARIKQSVIEAQEHSQIPFEAVVENLRVPREINRNPVFQTMFALQNTDSSTLVIDGIQASQTELDTGTSKFDLMYSLTEGQDEIEVLVEYSKELFDKSQIERIFEQYLLVANNLADQVNAPLYSIPNLSAKESNRILTEWNDTKRSNGRWTSMIEPFEIQASRSPDRTALVYEKSTLTYGELDAKSNQLAHFLQESGIKRGDAVAISVNRSLDMAVGLYGILKAGATYVPIDPLLPSNRIHYMLLDSKAKLLLVNSESRELLPIAIDEELIVSIDGHFIDYAKSKIDLLIDPQDVAYILYTSGSTGQPKGVAYTHAGSINFLLWAQSYMPLEYSDNVMQKTPFGFDVSVWELFWPLYNGARMTIIPSGKHADPTFLSKVIEDEGISVMNFVPSMLQMFLDEKSDNNCDSLRLLIVAGEAMTPALCEHAYEKLSARIINLYGPTEAGAVSYWDCEAYERLNNIPIGRPCDNFQLYILDTDLKPVPPMVVGELYIAGEFGLAQGYVGKSDLTAENFIPNPFSASGERMYKTGDNCRFKDNGEIEYLGRNDFQVKIRGVRIEIQEIETSLSAHPGVADCAVLALKEESEIQLVAFVKPKTNLFNDRELRSYLNQRLPLTMIPNHFITVEEFKTTINGKKDRKELTRLFEGREKTATAPESPIQDPEGMKLAEIWREVLKIDSVGLNSDFFDCGGNSFQTVKLLARIDEVFNVSLTIPAVFMNRTLGEQLELIQSGENLKSQKSLLPLAANEKPLLVLVHAVSGSVFPYLGLAKKLAKEFSVYGLQFGEKADATSILKMVEAYADEILALHGNNPIYLAGWSFGGLLSLEISRELKRRGSEVSRIIMLDSWLPSKMDTDFRNLENRVDDSINILIKQKVISLREKHSIRQAVAANIQALTQYRAEKYDGPVHLFQAEDALPLDDDDKVPVNYDTFGLGWRDYLRNLKVSRTRGNHYTLLDDAYLPELSNSILQVMQSEVH